MGRLKVTAKGKVKKNIPVTRIGKKQYLKRRYAHLRAVEVAGSNNSLTQKYIQSTIPGEESGGKKGRGKRFTAEQGFAHLGLRMDASAPADILKKRREKMPEKMKSNAFREEEEQIELAQRAHRENYIARPVDEQEGSMVAALLHAYGTDLKRMTYDHKLNPFQLNARQLQRQIVNYLKWEKAAFPKEFSEAEAKGWFSVEMFSDPKLRRGDHSKVALTTDRQTTAVATTRDVADTSPQVKASKTRKKAKKE